MPLGCLLCDEMCVAFQRAGAYEKALSIYKWGLDQDATRVDLWINSGIASFALEDYHKAILN